jgi:hypothetical protein
LILVYFKFIGVQTKKGKEKGMEVENKKTPSKMKSVKVYTHGEIDMNLSIWWNEKIT